LDEAADRAGLAGDHLTVGLAFGVAALALLGDRGIVRVTLHAFPDEDAADPRRHGQQKSAAG
jgi:hypothetical protein